MKRRTLVVSGAVAAAIGSATFVVSAGADPIHPVHHDGHHHLIHVDEHGERHTVTTRSHAIHQHHVNHGDVHGIAH